MFRKGKPARKARAAQFDTLISNKTSISGDVHFSGGLHIDGKVEGTIYAEDGSDAVLRISDAGEVEGDVYAPHIIINGTVYGNVYSTEDLELASRAAVHGNVYYHLIEMAMGAAVNGSLLHRKEGDTPSSARTLPSQTRAGGKSEADSGIVSGGKEAPQPETRAKPASSDDISIHDV